MADSVGPSASSLEALGHQYQTITHNLANASTTGYKRRRDLFTASLQRELANSAAPQIPSEIRCQTSVDFTQGALVQTGRALDLALDGSGLFVVDSPEGPRYTRNGSFQVNPQGQLVDFAGRPLAGQNGPIIVPSSQSPGKVQVSTDGTVSIAGQNIGKLRVVTFEDPKVLRPIDGTGFAAPPDAAPTDATKVAVHQGFQEASNVTVVEELVGLITVTRLYEANLKSINTQDERMKNILNVAMG
jgi:flagellar basal body rod protein FlgG